MTVWGSLLKGMKNVLMVFFIKNASQQDYIDCSCFVFVNDIHIFYSHRGIVTLAFGFLKCFSLLPNHPKFTRKRLNLFSGKVMSG